MSRSKSSIARIAYLSILVAILALPLTAQLKQYKPGFNLFSVQQDIQMGKEAADEVRKTMPVIDNADLNNYLNRIGQRLAKSPRAGKFPYTFSVINDKSINAFALPGGPMFIHTGLIAAADNEAQLAGVMAHEMSHVALRHGTNQASKANLIQLPAMLASGMLGEGSIWRSLGQLGIGLGAQSVLLKYSRGAEKDADLNGAQIMNDAGYDPVQMALFFQKLEGENGDNSAIANFLSDHPTPGRRVDYVQAQNKYLPKIQYYQGEAGALQNAKNIVGKLPAPPPPKAATPQGGEAQSISQVRPSGRYKQLKNDVFSINYPDNWEVFGAQDSPMVTVAPRGALIAGANNQTSIGYGMIISYYMPNGNKIDLNRDTNNLINQLIQSSPGLQRTNNRQRTIQVAGQKALLTTLQSPSPYPNENEVDMLMTLPRPEGLFYLVFIVPRSDWDGASRNLNDILGSIQFANR